jgi:GntR family transcriptional regulator/MocR family aminotransferase
MDEKRIVIYLGTFSKALFPGLRIGWITADSECIERITAIKRFSDLGSGNFVQSVLQEFLRRGYYDLHLKRLHRIFRRRMRLALEIMEEHFPAHISWTRPSGGYTIWVKMPVTFTESALHEFMAEYGVVVSPGVYYYPDAHRSECFRISIANSDEEQIKEGILRVGRALENMPKEV